MKIGFPDIIEIPSSISVDLTQKIEEIMKRHSLVKLQEAEWTAWRVGESQGWSSGSWQKAARTGHPAGDHWTQMWKYVPVKYLLQVGSMSALARFPAAEHQLSLMRSEIFEAEMAAAAAMRPTTDLHALGDEIDTLKELLHERVEVVAQRLALEETGSTG